MFSVILRRKLKIKIEKQSTVVLLQSRTILGNLSKIKRGCFISGRLTVAIKVL